MRLPPISSRYPKKDMNEYWEHASYIRAEDVILKAKKEKLEEIILTGRRDLKRIPDSIRGLKYLISLDLIDTGISDLEPLRDMTQIQELYLSRTGVENINCLENLRNLRKLWLHGTKVSDLKPVKMMIELRELWLNGSDVSDLRPLLPILPRFLEETKKSGRDSLSFSDTPATFSSNELADISRLPPFERVYQLQVYLTSGSKRVGADTKSALPPQAPQKPILELTADGEAWLASSPPASRPRLAPEAIDVADRWRALHTSMAGLHEFAQKRNAGEALLWPMAAYRDGAGESVETISVLTLDVWIDLACREALQEDDPQLASLKGALAYLRQTQHDPLLALYYPEKRDYDAKVAASPAPTVPAPPHVIDPVAAAARLAKQEGLIDLRISQTIEGLTQEIALTRADVGPEADARRKGLNYRLAGLAREALGLAADLEQMGMLQPLIAAFGAFILWFRTFWPF